MSSFVALLAFSLSPLLRKMVSPSFNYPPAFSIMKWYKMLLDSFYFLLWSKIYSILLLLGLEFLIEYVSYGVFLYLHVFVVSAILDCFLQIQCVSGLLIFQLD